MCLGGRPDAPPPPPPPPSKPEPQARRLERPKGQSEAQRRGARLGTGQLRIPLLALNIPRN